ncbi:hypothetical protein [Bradyrhizobium sp. Arg816]|uniref:hypothetical protein n=1 Tax=Bradyrhizobium sp. Arg816 TaxID=2998491 RepID=UPI00249E746B|nr:hypothetical protein [Bradyrhizobium sp. Arg816]MDI3567212.1 hypothetical protein [Bradyrhizobium sp. Arg816]
MRYPRKKREHAVDSKTTITAEDHLLRIASYKDLPKSPREMDEAQSGFWEDCGRRRSVEAARDDDAYHWLVERVKVDESETER